MADESVPEVPMEVVDPNQEEVSENGCAKRAREENDGPEQKRAKVEEEKSVEERRIESSGDGEEKTQEQKEEDGEEPVRVPIGPKTFESSVQMFDYFYKLIHSWIPNINLNKQWISINLRPVKWKLTEAILEISLSCIMHHKMFEQPEALCKMLAE